MKHWKLLYLVPVIALLLFWPNIQFNRPVLAHFHLTGTGAALTAQVTQHGVLLTATASVTPGVTYNVYRGTTTGGPYTQIKTGLTAPTYEDTTGTAGTKYYYVMTAVLGAAESVYSNEANATFLVVPAPPTGLGAVAN